MMSIQSKTVSAEPQSIWPLILVVLAIGGLVLTSHLTIEGDYPALVEVSPRVVREFPPRPNLLELEKRAYFARQAQQKRARQAETERYRNLGLFYTVGNENSEICHPLVPNLQIGNDLAEQTLFAA